MIIKESYKLFRLFGIDVRIHSTFILLPAYFAFIYTKNYGPKVGLRAILLVLLIFVFVLAHEFCHSLQARRFGIRVQRITLYPIGGIASMQNIPREPKKEFLISVVGPLFNFAAGAVLYFPFVWVFGKENLFSPCLDTWPQTLANAYWANMVLGAFNLIPAFPMDGGRIFRSILAMRLKHETATRISVFLGHFFATLFALFGIWTRQWMLLLIALFIFTSASDEAKRLAYETPHEPTH